jgi:hypothetical protein
MAREYREYRALSWLLQLQNSGELNSTLGDATTTLTDDSFAETFASAQLQDDVSDDPPAFLPYLSHSSDDEASASTDYSELDWEALFSENSAESSSDVEYVATIVPSIAPPANRLPARSSRESALSASQDHRRRESVPSSSSSSSSSSVSTSQHVHHNSHIDISNDTLSDLLPQIQPAAYSHNREINFIDLKNHKKRGRLAERQRYEIKKKYFQATLHSTRKQVSPRDRVIFILTGNKGGEKIYVPDTENVRCILIITAKDYSSLNTNLILSKVDLLVLQGMNSKYHGDLKDYMTYTNVKRIAAFIFSHYHKLTYFIVAGADIRKITYASSKNRGMKAFFGLLKRKMNSAAVIAVTDVGKEEIAQDGLGMRFFMINMVKIKQRISHTQRLFCLLPLHHEDFSRWPAVLYFQILLNYMFLEKHASGVMLQRKYGMVDTIYKNLYTPADALKTSIQQTEYQPKEKYKHWIQATIKSVNELLASYNSGYQQKLAALGRGWYLTLPHENAQPLAEQTFRHSVKTTPISDTGGVQLLIEAAELLSDTGSPDAIPEDAQNISIGGQDTSNFATTLSTPHSTPDLSEQDSPVLTPSLWSSNSSSLFQAPRSLSPSPRSCSPSPSRIVFLSDDDCNERNSSHANPDNTETSLDLDSFNSPCNPETSLDLRSSNSPCSPETSLGLYSPSSPHSPGTPEQYYGSLPSPKRPCFN